MKKRLGEFRDLDLSELAYVLKRVRDEVELILAQIIEIGQSELVEAHLTLQLQEVEMGLSGGRRSIADERLLLGLLRLSGDLLVVQHGWCCV